MCESDGSVYQMRIELTKCDPGPKSTLPFWPAVLDCLPETGVLYLSQSEHLLYVKAQGFGRGRQYDMQCAPNPLFSNLCPTERHCPPMARWMWCWCKMIFFFFFCHSKTEKKREILVIEGQTSSQVHGRRGISLLAGQVWVSGVLVKTDPITGPGRTINQQRPRGGAGTLNGDTSFCTVHTHTTNADRLTHSFFPPPSFSFCSFDLSSFLLFVLLSSVFSLLLFLFPSLFPLLSLLLIFSPHHFSPCPSLIRSV